MAFTTPFGNPEYFGNVAQSILDSAADALRCQNIDVPQRMYVGFERPAQDCCPDLVAWVSNIRVWDGDFPNTRTNGRLLATNLYAFDVTIRIGRCYIESDANGQPLDSETLGDFSRALYKDATTLYSGWLYEWRSGNVAELNNYSAVDIGPCTPYNSGGCAGWEFTITVEPG